MGSRLGALITELIQTRPYLRLNQAFISTTEYLKELIELNLRPFSGH